MLAVVLVGMSPARSAAAGARKSLAVASTRDVVVDRSGARTRRTTFTLEGLPVRGAYETLREDGSGTRVVAARHPVAPPEVLPVHARIDPATLPHRIADALALDAVPIPAAAPELVYLLVLGEPVLAWETELPLERWPEPTHLRVWMSAMTGRLLREEELVFSSRARIFPDNPGKTPDPIEVELDGVVADGPGVTLSSPRLRSLNCLSEAPAEHEPWWEEGECYPAQLAVSDESGDFMLPLPDVVRFEQNVQGSDLYAELSMFAHAERFFARMEALGAPGFRCEQATLLANFRDLEPSSSLPFSPLNNAYYTGECDPEAGPTMLFGQGSEVDFGYDGDVIYHELGHGMVAHLAPEGLATKAMRGDGLHNDARGINEGFADYFSLMVTGDPELGEYVGRFWASNAKPYIRTAENEKTCPKNVVGQEHNDGEPISAALWAARRRAENPESVDRLFLETLARLPGDATLDGTGQVMLEVASELVAEGTMDDETADVLYRALDARGLVDCPRVITDLAAVRAGRRLDLTRVTEAVTPFWPSPMQVRYVVPPGGDDLVAQVVLKAGKDTDPVIGLVLLKRGDTPITYTYDLVALDDPADTPPEDGAPPSDDVREVVMVRGDWDEELALDHVAENEYRVTLGGLQPGEVLHLTVVDAGPATLTATDFRVFSSADLPPVEEEATGTTGEGTTGESPGADDLAVGTTTSGCACTTLRSRSAAPSSLFVAFFAALVRRRGRRRS
jgi:hypothetical protein